MLQAVAIRPSAKRQRFVLRRRFELLGAILLVGLLPWAGFRWLITDATFLPTVYTHSLFANLFAVVVALWIRMSVETYPGIRAGQTILPAVLAGHALALGALVLLRLDYYRPSLVVGVALHLLWAYFMYFFVARRVRPMIAVVPFGDVAGLGSIDSVDWRRLTRPDLRRADGCHAIVADFDHDLPDDWEAFLADAALDGRVVYQVEQLKESLTGRVQVRRLSENSFGSLVPARAYSTIKHALDAVAALALLVKLAPVLLGCVIAVRLGGPARAVPPAAHRQGGAPVHGLQVPHDARGGGRRDARASDDRRQRRADHPGRLVPAHLAPRRIAAADQRADG